MVHERRGTRQIAGWQMLALLVLAGCAAEGEASVSDALIGVWTTDHADYGDRRMEFQRDALIFDIAKDRYTVHPVRAFRGWREDVSNRSRYRIVYTNAGQIIESTLYLTDEGLLTFEHQPGVRWRKSVLDEESAPVAAGAYRPRPVITAPSPRR